MSETVVIQKHGGELCFRRSSAVVPEIEPRCASSNTLPSTFATGTRGAAYVRAAADFLNWCEGQGIDALGRVQPVHVAAYIELLQGKRSAPTVKQHLACIRMLFDWLVIGQVMPMNPAHSVRGPVIRSRKA